MFQCQKSDAMPPYRWKRLKCGEEQIRCHTRPSVSTEEVPIVASLIRLMERQLVTVASLNCKSALVPCLSHTAQKRNVIHEFDEWSTDLPFEIRSKLEESTVISWTFRFVSFYLRSDWGSQIRMCSARWCLFQRISATGACQKLHHCKLFCWSCTSVEAI